MRSFYLFFLLFIIACQTPLSAQNYLRVSSPDWWLPPTNTPDWHEWREQGQFDEINIVAHPKGIYTEIELYATISQGPDIGSWGNEFEIVWQFELPGQTIVHDSWLWIDQEIIKADMVDYWTALQTYTDIVYANQDPSFFYRMDDGRYEIRIFPLFQGESRRIKMSFLVPAQWDTEQVKTDLLQTLLQSTDYSPPLVSIGMPLAELWGTPTVKIDNDQLLIQDTVINTAGELMHYLTIPGDEFVEAEEVQLSVDAPLTVGNTFLSTYSEGDENFYQMAFVTDWTEAVAPAPRKSLFLIDYNSNKVSFSKTILRNYLSGRLKAHYSSMDEINIGVVTSNGIQLLSDNWWSFDEENFSDILNGMLIPVDTADLQLLLQEGLSWAQDQEDIDHIYLLAGNDELVYPPAADAVFATIENLIPADVPISILDYQNENVSIVYYGNEAYEGNEYFYDLFSTVNSETSFYVYRNSPLPLHEWIEQPYPPIELPAGFIDFTTTLENGITFQRYNINDFELTDENKGVILQTGKYLGTFPMEIDVNLITTTGEFYNVTGVIEEADVLTGDTLMREMWYGPYLSGLELSISSDEDREFIIETSIEERVLTGLTAFLALEPNLGGEPCIECLLNSGTVPVGVEDDGLVDISKLKFVAGPNPATDFASIQLLSSTRLIANDWTAGIYDLSGRLIMNLPDPIEGVDGLTWEWNIETGLEPGIYFCKVKSQHGELIAKIVVVRK